MNLKILFIALTVAACLSACGGGGGGPEAPTPTQEESESLDLVSYGLEIRDAGGQLIASNAAPALHYIGAAAYVSTTTALVGSASVTKPKSVSYHLFNVTSPGGVPLPVIEVTPGAGAVYKIRGVTALGNNVYQIKLYSTQGSATKVHAFAPLPAGTPPAEAWGTRIMGPASDPRPYFDSTLKPLVLDAVVDLPEVTLANDPEAGYVIHGTLTSTPYTPPALARVGVVARGLGGVAWVNGMPTPGTYTETVSLRFETGAIQRVHGPVTSISNNNAGSDGSWRPITLPAENVFLIDLNRYLP